MSDDTQPAVPWAPVPTEAFTQLLLATGFSPEAYRDHYADLAQRNWNATDALWHFLTAGLNEMRIAPMTLNRQALMDLARLPMHDAAFKSRLLSSLGGHLFDATAHPYGPAITERWPVIQAVMNHGARPYFVAGDSHTNQYRLTGASGDLWLLPIHMLCTGGSAAGLDNPTSRSGYGTLLRQAVQLIETLPGIETIPFLLQFGQVDIEFVHPFQRVRNGSLALDLQDYRTFCERTAERYIRFVEGLFRASDRLRVFVVSVFPPALSDAAWRQGYVNADIVQRETDVPVEELSARIRTLRIANLKQRTEIHLYFNDLLRVACERLGFGFVDSATPFLGPDGTVAETYIVPEAKGSEHHLDDRQTDKIVRGLIWQCVEAATQSRA